MNIKSGIRSHTVREGFAMSAQAGAPGCGLVWRKRGKEG